ncbi:MAG: MOSC domain-containing protein [Pseudomonadales bacterium]
MKIGCIESIWRYAVKGMRGEEIPYTYTAYTGLMGDRVYGVVAAEGDESHPWHTGRDQEEFVLYKASYQSSKEVLLPPNLQATYDDWTPGIDPIYPEADAFRVSIETPAGVKYKDIVDPEFIKDLENITDRQLRVHFTQRGQFDARPVSLISLSAIEKLGEEFGETIDKRRFRANFYIQWENQQDPFYELSLVGKTLTIGNHLEVMIVERDPRCSMITLDPDTAEESPKLLQLLARKHGGDAGVFAAVLQRGRVNAGDPIYLK